MNKNPVATFVIKAQSGESLTVRIELYPDKAPITVANFTALANSGFYDGLAFHRVVPGGCIQGGGYKITETDKGLTLGYPEGEPAPIKGEFASNGWDLNDIAHEAGVISRFGDFAVLYLRRKLSELGRRVRRFRKSRRRGKLKKYRRSRRKFLRKCGKRFYDFPVSARNDSRRKGGIGDRESANVNLRSEYVLFALGNNFFRRNGAFSP